MIIIKTEKDIEHLKKAGAILASVLDDVASMLCSGITTKELDTRAETLIQKYGCRAAFKGYKMFPNDPPYPSTFCFSVNEELVHAPASDRVIQDGGIVSIDAGLAYPTPKREYFVDMAKTFAVGKINNETKKLIRITRQALYIGLRQIRHGASLKEMGRAIQNSVEENGFSVVRQLVGHGVGYSIHEPPNIPNYYDVHMEDVEFKEGMVLAIEPMVSSGSHAVKTLSDGWTVVTADGSLCAHFEHTVAVTKDGYEILTKI